MSMKKYRNISGESGVDSFEIGETYIKVKFKSKPRIYTYSHNRAGKMHVDKLKLLAQRGRGLNAYINSHVRERYDK